MGKTPVTFAWSKWAGLPLPSGSCPLGASWIPVSLSCSSTPAQGRFLGHLDTVVVPAPYSVALVLAQLARAEPRWLHSVAKMLQVWCQLRGYGVPGCRAE